MTMQKTVDQLYAGTNVRPVTGDTKLVNGVPVPLDYFPGGDDAPLAEVGPALMPGQVHNIARDVSTPITRAWAWAIRASIMGLSAALTVVTFLRYIHVAPVFSLTSILIVFVMLTTVFIVTWLTDHIFSSYGIEVVKTVLHYRLIRHDQRERHDYYRKRAKLERKRAKLELERAK